MPRPMSQAMLAAIAANQLNPALFVTATFATGPIYVWTGYGSIAWNGQTWLGIGTFGGISVIEEGSTIEAKGIVLTFSGFDANLVANVMGEFLLSAPVAIYLGFFAGNTLIADPVPAWVGRMDQPTVDITGLTASISINCENRLIEMNTPVNRRYTNDDQQLVAPGDLGLSFQSGIQELTIYWGMTPNSNNNM